MAQYKGSSWIFESVSPASQLRPRGQIAPTDSNRNTFESNPHFVLKKLDSEQCATESSKALTGSNESVSASVDSATQTNSTSEESEQSNPSQSKRKKPNSYHIRMWADPDFMEIVRRTTLDLDARLGRDGTYFSTLNAFCGRIVLTKNPNICSVQQRHGRLQTSSRFLD
jgi:hypothetical protein